MSKSRYFVTTVDGSEISKDSLEFWGIGTTEEESIQDALEWFVKNKTFMKTFECSKALYEFSEKHDGIEVSRNYFHHLDNEDFLDLKPSRLAVEDFCEKHNLSSEAKAELDAFFIDNFSEVYHG